MKNSVGHLPQLVKCFLEAHWDGQRPLLLAYSGGPDSKALLYAILEWERVPLHIVHVDHGWRESSRDEALIFQSEAERLGLPFHTTRFTKKTTEEEARGFRLAFFRELCETIPFQAVLLGHQADDLAETVLKRIFEGAHLSSLYGMNEITEIDGMALWRPLLNAPRRSILSYLKQRLLTPFIDPSNLDPHYLRARMRTEIIPFLNDSFGKNVSDNLAVLSERSRQLHDYLNQRCLLLQDKIVKGPFGIWVDATGLHPMEVEGLIYKIAKEEGLVLSRLILTSILDALKKGLTNREFQMANRRMIIDRGHFFLLNVRLPRFDAPIHLSRGVQCSGDWIIEMGDGPAAPTDWRSVWRGMAAMQCPEGEAVLRLPPPKMRWQGKIPAFLRMLCPVMMDQGMVKGEFLSGRPNRGSRSIKIFIGHEPASPERDALSLMGLPLEVRKTI